MAPAAAVSLVAYAPPGTGAITWTVLEPDGGTIDAAGTYTAPSCQTMLASGATGLLSGTAHVQATRAGVTTVIPVTVRESVLGLALSPGAASAATGTVVQYQANVTATCHIFASAPQAEAAPALGARPLLGLAALLLLAGAWSAARRGRAARA